MIKMYETPSVVSLKSHGAINAGVGTLRFYFAAAFVKGFHEGVLTVDPQRDWQPGRPSEGCTIKREYYGFNCEEGSGA